MALVIFSSRVEDYARCWESEKEKQPPLRPRGLAVEFIPFNLGHLRFPFCGVIGWVLTTSSSAWLERNLGPEVVWFCLHHSRQLPSVSAFDVCQGLEQRPGNARAGRWKLETGRLLPLLF